MVVKIVKWYEEAEETHHNPDRSFLWGDRTLSSSRFLFTFSAVGECGTYPGFTVVKELFEKTRPPEDRTGVVVLILVGVSGCEPEAKDSPSGDEGKYWRISRYPCWINPKNRTSRVYILSRTSPKLAGINDDMSPGSALEHSGVHVQPNRSGKMEGVYLAAFSWNRTGPCRLGCFSPCHSEAPFGR